MAVNPDFTKVNLEEHPHCSYDEWKEGLEMCIRDSPYSAGQSLFVSGSSQLCAYPAHRRNQEKEYKIFFIHIKISLSNRKNL